MVDEQCGALDLHPHAQGDLTLGRDTLERRADLSLNLVECRMTGSTSDTGTAGTASQSHYIPL